MLLTEFFFLYILLYLNEEIYVVFIAIQIYAECNDLEKLSPNLLKLTCLCNSSLQKFRTFLESSNVKFPEQFLNFLIDKEYDCWILHCLQAKAGLRTEAKRSEEVSEDQCLSCCHAVALLGRSAACSLSTGGMGERMEKGKNKKTHSLKQREVNR